MAAVHIPLLLTLPGSSDMSHPLLPSPLTPIKNQIPMDFLSRGSSLTNCWACGNWSLSSAHRGKTLSFVLYLQEQKLCAPGWTTGTLLPVLSSGKNITQRRLRNLTKQSLYFFFFYKSQEIPKPWVASLCLPLLMWIFSATRRLF